MKSYPNESWRELTWRENLPPHQARRLAQKIAEQPALSAEEEEERNLTRLLNQLPDVPVPSNFTALVLQEVAKEKQRRIVSRRFGWQFWARWSTRAAFAGLLGILSWVGFTRYELRREEEIARNVVEFSRRMSIPVENLRPSDILSNFEAIRRLNPVASQDDDELIGALAALQ